MSQIRLWIDRLKEKTDELGKKAAKKAAGAALDQGARAAGGIVRGAGKALGKAIFGEERADEAAASAPPPDPFAKLKAQEKQRAEAAEAERKKLDR